METAPELRRELSTFTLTLYGVGVMVGAGIYVLIGKVSAAVGNGVPIALVLAAVAALPTGLTYASLASRYPKSAGEAVFVSRAFGRPSLSFLVGYLILASGVASTAAVSHGFAHYLGELLGTGATAHLIMVVAFLASLSLVNYLGIRESTWLNIGSTLISVAALLLIVIAGVTTWGEVDLLDFKPATGGADGGGVALVGATALAFYAYIGYEDICNVAEEVKAPERTIPRATLLALAITSLLYFSVGVTVVSAVPAGELAASDVPLALVARRLLPALPEGWLNVVALFAVLNTALLNLVMSSRLLYGLARDGLVPPIFGVVDRRRQTPVAGVVAAFLLSAAIAVTGFLRVLAEATSAIILIAFFAVNAALIAVRIKEVPPDDPNIRSFEVPIAIPVLGLLTTGYLSLQFSAGAYLRTAALLAVGLVLYAVGRRR